MDPPRPEASATVTSCSGTDGLNQPIPGEAALEAVIRAFASAESATGETALVSPEAGPLETPFQPTSEVAPEANVVARSGGVWGRTIGLHGPLSGMGVSTKGVDSSLERAAW